MVIETEGLGRAVILPVQIITAECPKSSDGKIERRFDEVIIVAATRGDAVHGAEVVGVLVSSRDGNIKSLQKTLAHAGVNACLGKVLTSQGTGVICAATAAQCYGGGIERLIAKA